MATECWVYFIQVGSDGPIKIGSGGNPEGRLANLQVGNHEVLRVLGICVGDRAREVELQQEVWGSRIRGEWFRPTAEVLALVERCATEPSGSWDTGAYWARRAGISTETYASWSTD